MQIEPFINEEQDPKTAEKVLGKIADLLTPGEEVIYLAVQKKPAVTLLAEAVVVTNKRLMFSRPANLGLTTNFEIYSWRDLKEVSFKEEFFGAKFTAVPLSGENVTVEYIPKVQARKLYQNCNQQFDKLREIQHQARSTPANSLLVEEITSAPVVEDSDQDGIEGPSVPVVPIATTSINPNTDDVLANKLQRLKQLYDQQLITQEEYDAKKADILSQL